jgi:hypothetical protein
MQRRPGCLPWPRFPLPGHGRWIQAPNRYSSARAALLIVRAGATAHRGSACVPSGRTTENHHAMRLLERSTTTGRPTIHTHTHTGP